MKLFFAVAVAFVSGSGRVGLPIDSPAIGAWSSATLHDPDWQQRIRRFWDEHLRVLMSVKDGYAFFAVEKGREQHHEHGAPLPLPARTHALKLARSATA